MAITASYYWDVRGNSECIKTTQQSFVSDQLDYPDIFYFYYHLVSFIIFFFWWSYLVLIVLLFLDLAPTLQVRHRLIRNWNAQDNYLSSVFCWEPNFYHVLQDPHIFCEIYFFTSVLVFLGMYYKGIFIRYMNLLAWTHFFWFPIINFFNGSHISFVWGSFL